MTIAIEPNLRNYFRSLDWEERRRIGELIEKVRISFGQPHLHGGTGLRALGKNLYECRLDLRQRLVFALASGTLYFNLIGNHEDVRRFLKTWKG